VAIIRANLSGEIVQFLVSQSDAENVTPHPDTIYTLSFDPTTNPGLVASYNQNSAPFAMVGGTLTESGTPVTINSPSMLHTAFSNLPILISKLQTGDAFTTNELKQLLTVLLHHAGHL
jgi:hypothetical protein